MELRRRLIVLASAAGLGWLGGCSGATSPGTTTITSPANPATNPVTADAFVGLWQNVDANTGDNPQLRIRIDGSTIYVHGYGACSPTFCDWGEAQAPVANAATGTFTVTWIFVAGTNSSITYKLTLALTAGDALLHTTLAVHFTDGRADRSDIQTFKKSS